MFKSRVFLVVLFCLFILRTGISLAGQTNEPLVYFGKLAKGYPPAVVIQGLGLAGAECMAIDKEYVVFSLGPCTQVTGLLRDAVFLSEVYTDRSQVYRDPSLRKNRVVRRFLGIGAGAADRGGMRFGERGQLMASKEILALDQKLRLRSGSKAPSAQPAVRLPDDAYEPNNTMATAAAISAGDYPNLQCLDEDWYKITLSVGQDLVVTTITPEGDSYFYLNMYLLDASGTELDSASYRHKQVVRLADASAGTYYIHVNGLYGSTGPYSMTIGTGDLLGSIAGKVTDEAANAIPGLSVYFYGPGHEFNGDANTDSSGNFNMPLVPGTYIVFFEGNSAVNFIPEWFDNQSSSSKATPLTISAPGEAIQANAQLATGGIVSGKITSQSTGNGIPDCDVSVYGGNYQSIGQSDISGHYSVVGLATGQYKVEFYHYSGFVREYYNDKTDSDSADLVSVTAGVTTSSIDAQLQTAGTIRGIVKDVLGRSLKYIGVLVYDLKQIHWDYGLTDESGQYECEVVPPGRAKVYFKDLSGDNVSEWYSHQLNFESASDVIVNAGQVTGNIGARMSKAGRISGHVTDMNGDQPNEYLIVKVFDPWYHLIAKDYSEWDYSVGGLREGDYTVCFGTYTLASEWYRRSDSFAAAKLVHVAAGQTTSGIDARIPEAATLIGEVRNIYGVGLDQVIVSFYNLSHQWVASVHAYDGHYSYRLRPGSYRLFFDASKAQGNNLSEWYSNASAFEQAETVTLASGESRRIIANLASPSFLTITSPRAGDVWTMGSTRDITWTGNGPMSDTVKIQLYRGQNLIGPIANNAPNDGRYEWQIPSVNIEAATYAIEIITTDGKLRARSADLIIRPATLAIPSQPREPSEREGQRRP